VIEGDSLELASEHVRLIGIDAPEGPRLCQRDGLEWACRDEATTALAELVEGVDVYRAMSAGGAGGVFGCMVN
jgi:endonuclease YncB( thermonuclease family)